MQVDVFGLLNVEQQLAAFSMSTAKRKQILRKVGVKIIRDSKKRVQQQKNIEGSPFAVRKKRRKDRRKMLSKLIKQAVIVSNNGVHAVVGFHGRSGMIAARQQFGAAETVSAAQFGNSGGGGNGAASKRQAVVLRGLGYKRSNNRPASLKWIVDNLTARQAGAIIRSMRLAVGTHPQSSWQTVLPARAFLGVKDADVSEYTQVVFDEIRNL